MEHPNKPISKFLPGHIAPPGIVDLIKMPVNGGEEIIPGQFVRSVQLLTEPAAADAALAHQAQPALFRSAEICVVQLPLHILHIFVDMDKQADDVFVSFLNRFTSTKRLCFMGARSCFTHYAASS